jgi:topoisomerase-4 subunit A
MKVVKVGDKSYIGKDIMHVAIFQKNDERTTYNMIYMDGESGKSFAKRFNVTGVTRDKEYDLTRGHEKSKVYYFTSNPNGEAEVVKIVLSPSSKAHKKELEYNFAGAEIKGRSSIGITVTKYQIRNVRLLEAGKSTISGKKLWFDDQFGRLNTDEKGMYLGTFAAEEQILVVYKDGNYEITDQELTQRLDPENVILIEKFNPGKILTAVYLDKDKLQFNVKRFKIETSTLKNKFFFIKEGEGYYVEAVTTADEPILAMQSGRGQQIRKAKIKLAKVAEIMGWKAVGAKLTDFSKSIEMEWAVSKENKQTELFE